jgi:hypothetical protein
VRVAALALLVLAASGCAWTGMELGPPRLASCPGPIPSTEDLPSGDFRVQDRVRIRGGPVDVGYEVVAEKRGDRIVLVAFNAFGAKAFSVTQQGLAVTSRSYLGRALQVPPENLLRDLYAGGFPSPDRPPRVEVVRPGCGYTATVVTISRRPLP